MQDQKKTKKELIRELDFMRVRLKELEKNNLPKQQEDSPYSLIQNAWRALMSSDTLPIQIYLKDQNLHFVDANIKVTKSYGLTRDEFVGLTDFSLRSTSQTSPQKNPESDRMVLETGKSITEKVIQTSKSDGEDQWITVTKVPVFDERGDICGVVGICTSPTNFEDDRVEFRDDRHLLRTIIDNIPLSIFVKNSSDAYICSNKTHAAFHGKTDPRELEGMTTHELFGTQDATTHPATLLDDQMILTGVQEKIERQELLKDVGGTSHLLLTTKVPLKSSKENKIIGVIGISQNLTQLHNEWHILRTLVDNLPDFVYVKDTNSRFVMANHIVANLFGMDDPDEIRGKWDYDLFPKDLADKFYADEQAILSGQVQRIDDDEKGTDLHGNMIWVHTMKLPVRDPGGQIKYIVGIGRDISEQIKSYEQLYQQVTQLDERILLNLITDHAVRITGTRSSGLYKYDDQTGLLTLAAATNRPTELGTVIHHGKGIAGRIVALKKKSLYVSDYSKYRYKIPEHATYLGMVYAILLKSEGKVIGVLYIEDKVGQKISPYRKELFNSYGVYAASVLSNAIQIEEERYVKNQLEQLVRVNPVLMTDLRTMPLFERLKLIAQSASLILSAEACSVLLIKRPGFLQHEASFGYDLDIFPIGTEIEIVSGVKTGLTGHIASGEKPFNSCKRDFRDHPSVKGEPSAAPSRKCHTLLMMPLRSDSTDEVFGWIRLENKKNQSGISGSDICFTQGDMAIASLFADVIVTAIQAARIVDELNKLISVAPYGIVSATAKGVVTQTNPFAQRLLGYSATELDNINVTSLYDDSDEAFRIGTKLDESVNNQIENYETSVKHKSGEAIPIRLSVVRVLDSNLMISGTIGYFQDLREISQVQFKLEQSEMILRTLIDQIPDYVYVKDTDGNFVEVNQEAAWRMNLEHPSELIGHTDFDYFPPHYADAFRSVELEVMGSGQARVSYEEPIINLRTGDTGTLLTTKVPWIDPQTRQIKGIIGIGHDITKLRKVYAAADDLITLDRTDDILRTTVRHTHYAGEADWVTVVLFDRKGEDQPLTNFPEDEHFKTSNIRDNGLSKQIYRTRTPIIVPDISHFSNDPGINPITIDLKFKAVLGLPMMLHEKCIGVMWLHYRKEQDFKDEMIKNVQFYIQQATIAYDRVRRMESLEQMQKSFKITLEANAVGDHQKTLTEIVEGIREVMNCQAVTLYVYNPDSNDLNYSPTMTGINYPNLVTAIDRRLEDSFVYQMLQMNDILIISDTTQKENFANRRFVRDENIRSCVVIPLHANNVKVGVMFVNYRQQHNFEEHELTNIRLFAAQAAVAINNSRLYTMREQLFVNLAHEIHLPITGMIADSEVIRDELSKTSQAGLYELASHNLGQVQRAALITDTLLKTLGNEMRWQPVYTMHSVLRPLLEACELFESEARANGCEIREPKTTDKKGFPIMMMSLQDMLIAFKNIIGNAVKYSYRSNNHFIRIEGWWHKTKQGHYVISIQNYGVGITAEEIQSEKIFQLYYRGINATDRHRTGGGVGLACAARIIRNVHRGDIEVESTPQAGGAHLTTFRVILPVKQY